MQREVRSGTVVEFFERKRPVCAVCMEVKNERALVLTEQERETSVTLKRILHIDDRLLDTSQGRLQLVAALQEAATRRQDLASRVSVAELWDLVHGEDEGFDCQQLAEMCFSENITPDHTSAILRALLADTLYFKYKAGLFYANSPEKLEQIRLQHQRQAEKERQLAECSAWLAAVWRNEPAKEPENREHYVEMLKEFCTLGTEASSYQQVKNILSLAEVPVPQGAFQLLVKLGVWKEDENLYLHRFGIQESFPPEVLGAAEEIAAAVSGRVEEAPAREDITGVGLLTIDGPMTRDYDDALSVRFLAEGVEVGIHVADAAEFVPVNNPLDEEALGRATSLYLPDTRIPMLPPILSEELCSLKRGEERLALSLLVRFDEQDQIQSYRFALSRVQVERQLTYTEANDLMATDESLSYLFRLCTRLRRQRIARGALHLPLPELRVWVNSNGEIHISKVERETPAQLVVSELMILANALAGSELDAHDVPVIYRSQEKPQQHVLDEDGDSLYLKYLQRRYLSRAELGIRPRPHEGLGMNAYTSWTSPIRRYVDMVVQRQLKSMVLERPPTYGPSDLEEIIARLSLPQNRAMLIRREWTRYWVLKFLEKERIKTLDALVLDQGRRTYHLLLPDYLLEASMPLQEGRGLNPGDHFRVEIVRVNAREGILKLRMV
ncbi:MAG: ribonuclease catalytic domain-containing protein [Syntrophobacteria bacterium]